jgi:hypothetical protein
MNLFPFRAPAGAAVAEPLDDLLDAALSARRGETLDGRTVGEVVRDVLTDPENRALVRSWLLVSGLDGAPVPAVPSAPVSAVVPGSEWTSDTGAGDVATVAEVRRSFLHGGRLAAQLVDGRVFAVDELVQEFTPQPLLTSASAVAGRTHHESQEDPTP